MKKGKSRERKCQYNVGEGWEQQRWKKERVKGDGALMQGPSEAAVRWERDGNSGGSTETLGRGAEEKDT